MPVAHPPGHAQVDFGECVGVIGGVRMKLHVFCFDLPQSDACFVKAYAAETTETFLDGLPRKAICWRRRRGMHEFIRPVAGLFAPLGLDGSPLPLAL